MKYTLTLVSCAYLSVFVVHAEGPDLAACTAAAESWCCGETGIPDYELFSAFEGWLDNLDPQSLHVTDGHPIPVVVA